MKTRFSIELTTGRLTVYRDGAEVSSSIAYGLTARDIMDCEMVFTESGTNVTSTILSGTRVLVVGLRKNVGVGPALAVSSDYSLSGSVASFTFSLNTQEIVDLLAELSDATIATRVWFGVEVNEPDDSFRQTVFQEAFVLSREVNIDGDEPPATAAASATSASTYASQALGYKNAAEASATAAAASATAAAGYVVPSQTGNAGKYLKTDGTSVSWSAITSVGTITSGTWQGSVIDAQRGGFGANISAQSGVPIFTTGAATFTETTGTGSIVCATSPTLSTGLTLSTATVNTAYTVSGRPMVFSSSAFDSTYEFFTFMPVVATATDVQGRNAYGVRTIYELMHGISSGGSADENVTWAHSGMLAELLTEKENAHSYSTRQTAAYNYLNHHGTGSMSLPISNYSVMALRSPANTGDARGFDAHMFIENSGGEHAVFTPTVTALTALNMRSVTTPAGSTITSLVGVNISDQTVAGGLAGAIGTIYGVRIGTLSAGTTAVNGSANWGIYSASTVPHYFGGSVYLVGGITGNTTLTGTLTVTSVALIQNNLSVVRTGSVDTALNLTSDTGRSRSILFNMGATRRMALTATDSVVRFTTYDDSDNVIDNAITINRAAGGTIVSTRTLVAPAATTSISSIRIPHGTAPSSPVDGDVWTTTAGLYVRINGATVGPLS